MKLGGERRTEFVNIWVDMANSVGHVEFSIASVLESSSQGCTSSGESNHHIRQESRVICSQLCLNNVKEVQGKSPSCIPGHSNLECFLLWKAMVLPELRPCFLSSQQINRVSERLSDLFKVNSLCKEWLFSSASSESVSKQPVVCYSRTDLSGETWGKSYRRC